MWKELYDIDNILAPVVLLIVPNKLAILLQFSVYQF